MKPNTPLLEVTDLKIFDDSKTIFQNISFTLEQGETLAIMGPSGIGKSMLSKAIAGFIPSDVFVSGSIKLAGVEVFSRSLLQRESAQRPAVIFQDALQALNPLATIEAQLSLALSSNRTRLKDADLEQIIQLLLKLGFDEPEKTLACYPSQLSGGQRQRICIAIALLGTAQLIIADEPTSALDPVTENEILSLFRSSVKERNLGGLLITHDLPAALACDKLVVIDDGEMIAYGTPHQAIHESEHRFCAQVRELIG